MMALNEASVEKKLKTVNNTQDSIQSLSLWIIHHKTFHQKIVELWLKVLKKTVQPSHRLTLLYLCNDVIQNCKKRKAYIYNATFKSSLQEAAALVRDHSIRGKVERIFDIWKERGVYDVSYTKTLHLILGGKSVKEVLRTSGIEVKKPPDVIYPPEVDNDPISPPGTPYEPQAKEPDKEEDEDSAKILAEFKPHEMINQINNFHRKKSEIKIKHGQLSNLKLDASNLEAVKHLKDRTHGNDFSSHFDDSCSKLEDIVKRQTNSIDEQKILIDTLQTSENFYEEQYREAKIVANAYKNFGARINNMKKKLDELRKTFPVVESPIPSPDINAPSPDNTPLAEEQEFNFVPSPQSQAFTQNLSPPTEAPSPEGSPSLNLGNSENTSASFESRLASFLDPKGDYNPRLSSSKTKSYKSEDDGGNTPLDDEAPTTPVQDELSSSPPKRETPPMKENPIDFLSRLITQKSSSQTTKSGNPSFLDTLSPLLSGKTDIEPTQSDAKSSWDPWQSKSDDLLTQNQPVSSRNYPLSQSSSPTTYPPLSSALPMVPPPPIPMPVPPPIGINFSVPPPPPPPISLTSGSSPSFNSPPLGFQQTSPGQKENWPDANLGQSSDLQSGGRLTQSAAVLKELMPGDSFESKSGNNILERSLSNDMEVVSDEEKDGELEGDMNLAKADFAEKLKQKTSNLKSSIYVPSKPSNLLTLTSEDGEIVDEKMDLDDDLETLANSRPSKSFQKSTSRSRSRSRSRSKDRDRSHKAKKKKKHRRSFSDDGDSSSDSKSFSNIMKRTDPRSQNKSQDRDTSRHEDKFKSKSESFEDEDERFVRYRDSSKYDSGGMYNDGRYSDRPDNRSYDSFSDSPKSFKDNAPRDVGGGGGRDGGRDGGGGLDPSSYLQAYRQAMVQQLQRFPGPPSGPRGGHGGGRGGHGGGHGGGRGHHHGGPRPPHPDPRRGRGFRKY